MKSKVFGVALEMREGEPLRVVFHRYAEGDGGLFDDWMQTHKCPSLSSCRRLQRIIEGGQVQVWPDRLAVFQRTDEAFWERHAAAIKNDLERRLLAAERRVAGLEEEVVELQGERKMTIDYSRQYIAELEKKIERLERHNAIFHPEYDLERAEPLDVGYEAGRRAAWLEIGNVVGDKIWGTEWEKANWRMAQQLADIEREVRDLWDVVMEEPFPDDLYRADVVKQIRRCLI